MQVQNFFFFFFEVQEKMKGDKDGKAKGKGQDPRRPKPNGAVTDGDMTPSLTITCRYETTREQQKPFRSETAGEIKVKSRQHAFKAITPLLGGWQRNRHLAEA